MKKKYKTMERKLEVDGNFARKEGEKHEKKKITKQKTDAKRGKEKTAALLHLQTTSSRNSKSVNENLDQRNFSVYCRYDSNRSNARSCRNTTHK